MKTGAELTPQEVVQIIEYVSNEHGGMVINEGFARAMQDKCKQLHDAAEHTLRQAMLTSDPITGQAKKALELKPFITVDLLEQAKEKRFNEWLEEELKKLKPRTSLWS